MSGISINIDNSHFFYTRSLDEMTPEGVDAAVGTHSGRQVREIIFNANAQRTSFPSKVWDQRWEMEKRPGQEDYWNDCLRNMAALEAAGIDAYARWMDESRRLGVSPWISMRMNDIHHVSDADHPSHSTLWRERPDLRRVTYRPAARIEDFAFDYARPEVYDHHLALVRELLDRYDTDGIELDFCRNTYYLRPGFETVDLPVMTRFVQDTRRLVDKAAERLGHGVKVGVRVPPTPEAARGHGLDGVLWAREGLIDFIVPTPRWYSVYLEMPLGLWRELIDGTGVTLGAGIERHVHQCREGGKEQATDPDTVRGAAAVFLHAGADRVYLFNHFDRFQGPLEDSILGGDPPLLDHIGELDTVVNMPRRHMVTYSDTPPPGRRAHTTLPVRMWASRAGRPEFGDARIELGPIPSAGSATVVVAFSPDAPSLPDGIELYVNGSRSRLLGESEPARPGPATPAYAFDIPLAALHDGRNAVELCARESREVQWIEVRFSGAG